MRHCICWLTVCVVKGMDGVHGGGEDALTAWGEVSSGIVGFCGAFNLFVLCFVFCVLCFRAEALLWVWQRFFAPFGYIVFMLLCEGFVLSRVTTTVIRHLFPSTVIFPCGVLYRQ